MPEPERFRSQAYLDVIDAIPSPRRCHIRQAAIAAIHAHAERGYPLEVCGLLIGTTMGASWRILAAKAVANLNQERAADRFQLDPAAYRRIDMQIRGSGREIVGVYHSHPDCPARPSPTDLANAWEGLVYAIVGVSHGEAGDLRLWTLNEAGSRFQEVMAAGT